MNPVRLHLRQATQARHDRVDALFGRFDLADPSDYAAFLLAHAAVLPSAEAAVAGLWSGFRPRMPALMADLADLDLTAPTAEVWPDLDGVQRWGALYVLEGSRLGGVMLAQRVGAGLPRRYLESRHAPGAWLAFQEALGAAVPEALGDQATIGAHRMFDAFEAAAVRHAGSLRGALADA